MADDVTNKKMVVGFLFSGPYRVLLVRKLRPSWQAGLLNGVGGVIENDETPIQAIVREFHEETGHGSDPGAWRHFATERESFGAWIYFFSSVIRDSSLNAWPTQNDAGESLHWINTQDLWTKQRVGNLSWLIPLALDPRGFSSPILFEPTGDIREKATW